MKIFKSILISLALLLISSLGVMADGQTVTAPTAYINADGTESTETIQWTGTIGQSQQLEPTASTQTGLSNVTNSLVPSANNGSQSWYWGGGNTAGTPVNVATLNIDTSSNRTGTINIVVGPNGDGPTKAALVVQTGGLTIPEGVTVNIYQAANGVVNSTDPVPASDCFLTVVGDPAASQEGDTPSVKAEAPTNAVTVNGTLNINSGAFQAEGSNATSYGLQIGSTGVVTVEDFGSVEVDAPITADKTTNAIEIATGGELNANGGFLGCYTPNTSIANASITGLSGLTVDGGSVWTGISYNTANGTGGATLKNGLWANSEQNFTAFGTSALQMNAYSFGEAGLTVQSGNSFNILNNADFTLEDNMSPITFSSGSSLEVGTNGKLTIPANVNVTMNQGSTLTNNGTIDVLQNPPSQS